MVAVGGITRTAGPRLRVRWDMVALSQEYFDSAERILAVCQGDHQLALKFLAAEYGPRRVTEAVRRLRL